MSAYAPERYRTERLTPHEALVRSAGFLRLMRTRRSVRQFAPDPVARTLIENAIRVASSAPSGANQQPWTFVVVTDPETKRRIREGAERETDLLEVVYAINTLGTGFGAGQCREQHGRQDGDNRDNDEQFDEGECPHRFPEVFHNTFLINVWFGC